MRYNSDQPTQSGATNNNTGTKKGNWKDLSDLSLSVFMEWHDILGTLVHELTHNTIGSHSADFYALMDEL